MYHRYMKLLLILSIASFSPEVAVIQKGTGYRATAITYFATGTTLYDIEFYYTVNKINKNYITIDPTDFTDVATFRYKNMLKIAKEILIKETSGYELTFIGQQNYVKKAFCKVRLAVVKDLALNFNALTQRINTLASDFNQTMRKLENTLALIKV